MAGIGNKKAFAIFLQSWNIEGPKIYKYSTKSLSLSRKQRKLKSEIDSRKKKFSWCENPERYIPKRCAITITSCKSDDATESHTQKMQRGQQTY